MFDLLVQSGLMTRAPDKSERWDGRTHSATLATCDTHRVYAECGWTYLVGYQNLSDTDGTVVASCTSTSTTSLRRMACSQDTTCRVTGTMSTPLQKRSASGDEPTGGTGAAGITGDRRGVT